MGKQQRTMKHKNGARRPRTAERIVADIKAADTTRDGSHPVQYKCCGPPPSFKRAQSSGGLFVTPPELEHCEGGWRCLVQQQQLQQQEKGDRMWQELTSRGGGSDSNLCDIPVLTPAEFSTELFDKHLKNIRPFLIRQTPGGAEPFRTEHLTHFFSRSAIKDSWGQQSANVGTSLEIVHQSGSCHACHSEASSGGRLPDGCQHCTWQWNIDEYVETFMPSPPRKGKKVAAHHWQGDPLYIFERGIEGIEQMVEPALDGLFPPPNPATIWMQGPPLSGSAFHYHGEAWTGMLEPSLLGFPEYPDIDW